MSPREELPSCFLHDLIHSYLPFEIPTTLQPSTGGRHVENKYHVALECDIPGAIDLVLNMGCTICAPQFLFLSAPPQPKYGPLPPDTSFRPDWEDPDIVKNCRKCGAGFHLFRRKHHCRHCLKVHSSLLYATRC
jgi:hypothetical protein